MERIILITGGSDGLGKATAKRLSENKENKIIILSNDEIKIKKVAKEINVDYIFCDVTDFKSVQNAIDTILEKYKTIDILINNAGVWLAGDLTDCSYEKISNCIDVNTK